MKIKKLLQEMNPERYFSARNLLFNGDVLGGGGGGGGASIGGGWSKGRESGVEWSYFFYYRNWQCIYIVFLDIAGK